MITATIVFLIIFAILLVKIVIDFIAIAKMKREYNKLPNARRGRDFWRYRA